MTIIETQAEIVINHEAMQLQGGHLPEFARDRIIASHTNYMSDQSRSNFEWKEGRLNPKVVLITDYVNDFFNGLHEHPYVVSYADVENAYAYHFELMERDPYAAVTLTALTALTYATDLVSRKANGSAMTAYLCQNEITINPTIAET